VHDVPCVSALHALLLLLPPLLLLLLLSDTPGVSGMPEFSAYSASKHACVGLMRSAAAEYAPKGIRINCINPATTGREGGRRTNCIK
jgi:NAD(P)-dependent dehydrogenase (short-subunit alcohol dehydrogenase family)